MRRWCAFAGLVGICLLAPVFSGCIMPVEDPLVFQGPVRLFTAHYGQHDRSDDLVVSLEVEQGVFADDAEHRESLHLSISRDEHGEEGYHLDGALGLVRREPVHGTWIEWSPWRLPSHGMLWPLLLETDERLFEHRHVEVEHHGGTFTIEDSWRVYHYEYGQIVPYLVVAKVSGEAELTLKRLEQGEEQEIDPWPEPSLRQGDRDLLFPGADEVWADRPASFQRMFNGLMDHSDSVREMIELGGCLTGLSSGRPETRPWMSVLGQQIGEPVRVYRTEFHVLAPPQGYDPGHEDGLDDLMGPGAKRDSPSSHPGHYGEVWEVGWAEHPLEEDSVEYKRVREGQIGYKPCDEIAELEPPVSLQEAWEQTRKAPGAWEDGNVSMGWRIGSGGHHGDIVEKYDFSLVEPQEDAPDRTLVSLRLDASTGRFLELHYDGMRIGSPDA